MNRAAPLAVSLLAAWDALPGPVRARLALASAGWPHLARAGADCLRAARETGEARLFEAAGQMLLWAWGEAPLHGPLAAEILAAVAHPQGLPLPAAARAGLEAVADGWRAPSTTDGGMAYFQRLAARRDPERLARFLAGQIEKDPAGLFWREKALALALFAGQGEISEGLHTAALAGLDANPALAPVTANLRAQAAFLRGDTGASLDASKRTGDAFGPAFGSARSGLALLDAGEDAAALPRLLSALRCAPWQAGLALVAADVLSGARRELSPPPGPVAILLYSWNKADDLDATLASLAASELHVARAQTRIIALNNGSTDRTAQVLEGWQARLGETLEVIPLPVNIGAAAARNWLAATPTARASETLVYLDDDVDVPADWLGKLGAAMRRLPGAGVWGCKVADHAAPRLLQNVAGMLAIPAEAPSDAPKERPDIDWQSLSPNPFRLLDAHLHGPDWGLFDHISPCSSVTGCCHAFRRSWLDAEPKHGGGFSLALMPSQYDDFERDLRMLDGGGYAAYTGHLRVRHRKRSGLDSQAGQKDEAGAGAAGNRYKMQCMHDRASIARHIDTQDRRAQEHVCAALSLLDATGEIS